MLEGRLSLIGPQRANYRVRDGRLVPTGCFKPRRRNLLAGCLGFARRLNLPAIVQANDGSRQFFQVFRPAPRLEEHTSELQSRPHLVCRLLLEKKKSNWRQAKESLTAIAFQHAEQFSAD